MTFNHENFFNNWFALWAYSKHGGITSDQTVYLFFFLGPILSLIGRLL